MDKHTKNIITTTGIIATGVTAVSVASYALTNQLVKIAIHRDGMKHMKNIGNTKNYLRGFCNKEEFLNTLLEKGAVLEDKETTEVHIRATDGEHLVAHWYPCKEPQRIIIAMHGWRSTWSRDFGIIADFWHENHCHVLFVEQRGQNNSGGNYMCFGLKERFDCGDWIHWALKHTAPELPIYLAGASMGATTVLMASGLEMPKRVCGIMADCGFTSPHAIWEHVVKNNLHISYRLRKRAVESICHRHLKIKPSEYSTTQAMEQNKLPILFVHGAEDHFVPVEMTYENYKACTAPKYLLIVPGADHGMSYYMNKPEYEAITKRFWQEYDTFRVDAESKTQKIP